MIGAASASFFLASQFLIRLSIYNPRLLKISLGRAVKCGGTIPAFALFMKLDLTSGPLSGDANLLRFREEPAAPRRAKNPSALEKLRQDFAAATHHGLADGVKVFVEPADDAYVSIGVQI